ncbi:MAG: prevent-host-death protein [Saprospiraceae bacterium]|nr:prevent-host-death protein [Saprospiraceae bacterium]
MKTLSVGEFKTRFSEVIDWIEKGETIEVTFGKSKKIIGYFSSKKEPNLPRPKRKIGILEDRIQYEMKNWIITNEEMISDEAISY